MSRTRKQTTVTTASTTRVNVPSASSHLFGGSRRRPPSPISNGATVMTPSASETNQFNQVISIGVPELWNSANPAVPPIPETAVPIATARKRLSAR